MKKTQMSAGIELIPAVGYIRMSTDQQEDSPARQRVEIEKLAARDGYRIIAWYEDHGLTGTESANRPEFQSLLQAAARGEFQAILLSEQSRFSREDPLDVMFHWRLLRDAGVKLVSSQGGELDFGSLGGLLMVVIGQHGAHDESIKIADRSVSGKLMKAKQGKHISGALFAFDREIVDESGEVMRRVHFQEKFKKPPSWNVAIVPSADTASVDGLRFAFESIRDGKSYSSILREFDARGLTTTRGKQFNLPTLMYMLKNPAYAGIKRSGHACRGKFSRMDSDGLLWVEDAHTPIIDRHLFDEVQDVINDNYTPHMVKAAYLLRKLVYCAHCGLSMSGSHGISGHQKSKWRVYKCYSRRDGRNASCSHPGTNADYVEQFVLDVMKREILSDENVDRYMERLESSGRVEHPPDADESQLEGIRKNIKIGKVNLARAETPTEFADVSSTLLDWRDEEAALLKKLKSRRRRVQAPKEAADALLKLSDVRDHLDQADPELLSLAIRKTIKRISIGISDVSGPHNEHREWSGHIEFHPDVYDRSMLPISDDDLAPRTWKRIAAFLQDSGKVHSAVEIREQLGCGHAVWRNLKRATQAGRVRKSPCGKGFCAVT